MGTAPRGGSQRRSSPPSLSRGSKQVVSNPRATRYRTISALYFIRRLGEPTLLRSPLKRVRSRFIALISKSLESTPPTLRWFLAKATNSRYSGSTPLNSRLSRSTVYGTRAPRSSKCLVISSKAFLNPSASLVSSKRSLTSSMRLGSRRSSERTCAGRAASSAQITSKSSKTGLAAIFEEVPGCKLERFEPCNHIGATWLTLEAVQYRRTFSQQILQTPSRLTLSL